jgi:BMFP domain-containing protein YqiC
MKRAYKVQIPCHSKFQCSFHGLGAEAPTHRTVLELPIMSLQQFRAAKSEVDQMDSMRIDEIARRLFESVPPAVRTVQKDLENNFRAVLRASLTKLDLVARDEFDAQVRVLERTRARLEELEKKVAALDSGASSTQSSGANPEPGGH